MSNLLIAFAIAVVHSSRSSSFAAWIKYSTFSLVVILKTPWNTKRTPWLHQKVEGREGDVRSLEENLQRKEGIRLGGRAWMQSRWQHTLFSIEQFCFEYVLGLFTPRSGLTVWEVFTRSLQRSVAEIKPALIPLSSNSPYHLNVGQ